MSILSRVSAAYSAFKRDWSGPMSEARPEWFAVEATDAGVSVTPEDALRASAVYACVNVIASAVATLPVHVVKRADGENQLDHPLYQLLHESPNAEQTAAELKETLMANVLLWGRGYIFIDHDAAGNVAGLYPLRSAYTLPKRSPAGELYYENVTNGKRFALRPDQVWAVNNLSLDGKCGVSPVSQAKNAIGLAIALEKFGARFFSNGGNLGGILKLPPGMKPESIKSFVASWKQEHAGLDNAFRTAVLPEGYGYERVGTDPEKAQMLDTRTFQVREIARIYRVPLHKIGDLEHATFSNIEHQGIEFAQDTIQPWITKIEQDGNRKLFTERDRRELEIRFNMDALLRSDTKSRYEAHNIGVQGGWLKINEVRAKENLPPVDGGDKLLAPLNMAPVGDKPPGGQGEPPAPAGADAKK